MFSFVLFLAMLSATAMSGSQAVGAGGPPADAEIVVSPQGNDVAHGSAQEPVASLHRAQMLARSALADGQRVTVTLRGGVYRLGKTLVFTQEDSGTAEAPALWQASPGQQAVISGGTLLKLKWEPFRDGIFKAAVPTDFAPDQLFVGGVCQHMARYPNFDQNQRIMNGYAADCISPERVARWADPTGGFIHAMHAHLWGDFHYRITGKNADGTLSYEGGWQNNRQMGMHSEYRYVENIFEELDAPGEWYHDANSHTLYFYPPQGTDLDNAVVEIARLRHLIEFRGCAANPVAHITFRGITFTHTSRTFMDNREPLLRSDWTTYRGGALLLDGADDCHIEKCTIDQVGGNAIFFSDYNRNCAVQSCRISDVGANGIAFVGDPNAARSPLFEYDQRQDYAAMDKGRGPSTDNYPADCLVEDCLIYRTGRVEKQTAPVEISLSAKITVRHCSIYEVPRAGINIGDGCWGGHVIEYCDVFDTVRETGDHGSFNSWGRDRYWLPNIKEVDALVAAHPKLPTLDCIEPITIRNSRWRCDHGWDIDLDDGSSYYHIYNNLCLNGGIKNREGFGREVENNVLVNNSYHPHVWYARSGDVFRRNIIFTEYQPVGVDKPWGVEVDRNLLHRPGAPVGPATQLQEESGRDEHSLVGDAMFVDSERGDYGVGEGSPALGLGFVNFPMDQFGVVSPELKRVARTPLPAVASTPIEGGDQRIEHWFGAEVKSVTTPGEVSATGLGRAEGVFVVRVPLDSEAARAGLRRNDVILRINSNAVADWKEFNAAWQAIAGTRPVQLAIWREQKKCDVEVGPSR
jgi:PDZ domain/Right handed beta helix region